MTELARIASALERIADALETPNEPARDERVSKPERRDPDAEVEVTALDRALARQAARRLGLVVKR